MPDFEEQTGPNFTLPIPVTPKLPSKIACASNEANVLSAASKCRSILATELLDATIHLGSEPYMPDLKFVLHHVACSACLQTGILLELVGDGSRRLSGSGFPPCALAAALERSVTSYPEQTSE